MPFTISHAAAVLPFVRRDGSGRGRLVPSLLVAGSFAPDVTYFVASAVPGAMGFGDFTHSFVGVFTVDVLIALALVGLERLVREPVLALLPRRVRGRVWALLRGPEGGPGRWWPVWWYVSAALGATTHVVWDAFTHPGRWGMRVFPVLGEEVGGSPLYWYAQYGSSALAMGVVAMFVWRALRGVVPGVGGPVSASGLRRWGACVLIGGCVCGCAAVRVGRWLSYVEEGGLAWKPWEIVPTLCFGAGAGVVLGVVLYAAVCRVAAIRTRRAQPHPEPADLPG
ncbi:DUF4184 family protein [Streptomyces kunmingensis]|uniref:DUF4184 family protein n=1 Tax=Streptomyces kunmingensis TaxID=68225 RepID=A0ABU6CNE0_9ACTN|nr:DUF4184 family protein [Streptomyces kunmingensis]MEB3965597.1 DUF4184 family protein [Streptomyces kunmingensis]